MEHEVLPELDGIQRDAFATECAVHSNVVALIDAAPSTVNGVPKPAVSYDEVVAGAARNVEKARDLLEEVCSASAWRPRRRP